MSRYDLHLGLSTAAVESNGSASAFDRVQCRAIMNACRSIVAFSGGWCRFSEGTCVQAVNAASLTRSFVARAALASVLEAPGRALVQGVRTLCVLPCATCATLGPQPCARQAQLGVRPVVPGH